MTEKVEYEVLASLKASGSLAKQMRMLMGSTSNVQKNLDKIQSGMSGAGRAIMGTTTATAAGWAKTGGTIALAAGATGMGGIVHQGLAYNAMLEDARNSIGSIYQIYNQNQGNVTKNLQQAEYVQRRLFDIAKKSPGEFEDAVAIYKGAAASMTVAGESIAAQMKTMEGAVLLPSVVGGGIESAVVGNQLGRIMSGGAGQEFETWVRLAPSIKAIGVQMAKTNKAAKGFTDEISGGDLTQVWNKMAQSSPALAQEMIKEALKPLAAMAPTFEASWEGILGTTMSSVKQITGAFTKPFFEMRKAFLARMNKSGIFSDKSIGRLEHIATVTGILFAEAAERVFVAGEKAVVYIRDHWRDVVQNVHDAFVIGQAALKGAFAYGLTRMMAGAAMIAASFAVKGVRAGKKVYDTGLEKASQLAFMREAKKLGLDPSQRPRDDKGQFVSFQKAFASLREKRVNAVGEKYSKGIFQNTDLAPIMKFFAKIGPLTLILGAGIPLVVMAVGAFGALFTIVGGIAAYVVTHWEAMSTEIVNGLRDGTITLQPLLIAAYTFWERLKMVGQVFLGSGGHAAQFSRVLDLMTGAVAFGANAISFFMRAIAYSIGIWGALKLAFQGVLKAVLAIIEMSQYLPGVGASDDFVAHARKRYDEFSNSVQDTFTTVDKLLTAADDIDAFTFKQVDLERINKEADEMAKKLADSLENFGKEDKDKLKGPKGPKVQINHLTINQDLRDTDPDRLMAAFIKPLERLADQRVQAYDVTEQGV